MIRIQVRYAASIEKTAKNEAMWSGNDNSVFDNVNGSKHYIKEIYFFPSDPPEPVYLWGIGHEKATKDKAVLDRLWQTCWVLHLCVGGKGYYNDRPIARGDCFLSAPYFKHSITADPDDPFEFYWVMLSGVETKSFVHNNGFRDTELVFSVTNVDEMASIFELGMTVDYSKTDVYGFTMGLLKMIFSYCERGKSGGQGYKQPKEYGKNYANKAKLMLRDSNYTMSVSELANKLGLTPNYLGKLFYADKGETLKQYIMRKRFQTAESFLKNGMLPLEVSRAVGYKDYTAFYTAFVARYHMSPSEYAESVSKKSEDDERD